MLIPGQRRASVLWVGPLAIGFVLGAASPTARAWDEGPMCERAIGATAPLPFSDGPEDALTDPEVSICLAPPMSAPPPAALPSSLGDPGSGMADPRRAALRALRRAQRLQEAGQHARARLLLEQVSLRYPRLVDRVAMMRAESFMQEGESRRALAAFRLATQSPDRTVQVRARVGEVRALVALGHPDAEDELHRLLWRYPELPEEVQIRFEMAAAAEARAELHEAASIYRRLDITRPEHPLAARARARLEAMRQAGFVYPPLTSLQAIERAERLVRNGPFPLTRLALSELQRDPTLSPSLQGRLSLMLARMARVEGRWADADRYMRQGLGAAPSADEDESDRRTRRAADMADAANARQREVAESRIAQVARGRRMHKMPTGSLLRTVGIAAQAGMAETVDDVLEILLRRDLPPRVRFDVSIAAAGVGNDAHQLRLLEGVAERPGELGVMGRYHYARTLERLGRLADAEREFVRIMGEDRSDTRYYAMWAELRLWSVRERMLTYCGAGGDCLAPAGQPIPHQGASEEPVLLAASRIPDLQLRAPRKEGTSEPGEIRPSPREPAPNLHALAATLRPVADAHEEAFPWFARAADLLELEQVEAAGEELYEAFLAYREASGRAVPRAGLESVYRGANRVRSFPGAAIRRDRANLPAEAREIVAGIAERLGEVGTAVGFAGWHRAGERPRAYADSVERAAARHGLDPNLLFAVMRVESVYQRRIVSYAGAVGLMQIMPRTGRHIANAVGKEEYTTADLLDPETNLDFAAWYLASLIERFDGRLPLAIASYNGGPHNVRRWMQGHALTMPLDAFLEEIPFEQTHRYVRRVLTHYAAYRAQQGLPMQELSLLLPQPETDELAF